MKNWLFIIFLSLSAGVQSQDWRYFNDLVLNADSSFSVEVDSKALSYSFEVRAALAENKERNGKSHQKWGIMWNYVSHSGNVSYNYAVVQCGNTNYGDFLDQRYAEVKIGRMDNGVDEEFLTNRLYKGVDMSCGYNSFLLEWESGKAKLFIGDKEFNHIATIDTPNAGECGILTNDLLNVMSAALEVKPDVSLSLRTEWTERALDEYFSDKVSAIEGYWKFLDRKVNAKKAKVGGEYRFAIIKDGEEYLILYMSGAVTNASKWKGGMIKGRLKPTIFQNHYDLIWYDSMMEIVDKDAYADIIDGAILNLQFPVYEASFRLSQERQIAK